jgi:xanthine dehydrogenase small subunit
MPVHFLLNGELRAEQGIAPSTTVLDYLRGHARLTGTKEGCAEGDCGACTIVVSRSRDGKMQYEAVNSCLMLLPQLDGASVTTVEGLASNGELHPVQKALVETDGTQCGFCTPGFVMALYAFQQGGEPVETERIHDALAGNLCRCTGYKAIVAAAHAAAAVKPRAETVREVPSSGDYRCAGQTVWMPRTLDELVALRGEHPDAVLIAGGTDLGLKASKDREQFPKVILTGAVQDMCSVAVKDGALEIGGAATYTMALPLIEQHFPSFAALIRRIGSRQIRNLGTLAGNMQTASPIGDTPPCLAALGAEVTLASRAGKRTLPVEQFVTGYRQTALKPDEVIASIRIPLTGEGTQFTAYKLSKRFDQDISTVVAAFALKIEGGKVASLRAVYGGMAATTKRATNVEQALIGKPWTAASLATIDDAVAKDFQPLTDFRGTAAYRLRAAAGLIRRLQIETTTDAIKLEAL